MLVLYIILLIDCIYELIFFEPTAWNILFNVIGVIAFTEGIYSYIKSKRDLSKEEV